jgi:hypothetical protein
MQRRSQQQQQQQQQHFQKTYLLKNDVGPPIPPSRNNSTNHRNGLQGMFVQHHPRIPTTDHQRGSSSLLFSFMIKICFTILLILLILVLRFDSDRLPLGIFNTMLNSIQQHLNERPLQQNKVTIEDVQNEFYHRYGGIDAATQIYHRGIQAFGNSLNHTAERLLRIIASSSSSSSRSTHQQLKTFVLSFAGYSVTVGRGNYYNQSYPFVVERILAPLFQTEFNNEIQLIVRNSAIGGIPSFPYGFCFNHFLGNDANVISWDYSMNEGKASTVLEAYIRQSQNQLSDTQPMMIVLDTNQARCQLLESYIQSNLLLDGICVGMAKDAVINLNDILQQQQQQQQDTTPTGNNIPIGFHNWDEFGSPPSCPGRGNWHPKKMEHELIGWMIAMYFVDAIKIAKQIIHNHPKQWKQMYTTKSTSAVVIDNNMVQFPLPITISSLPDNTNEVTNMLYGHMDPITELQYTMNHISCRTNFLPAMDVDTVLSSIIVDGYNNEASTSNVMVPRMDSMYEKGWVFDVSNTERETKVKVEQCGGLGYVDMKISLHGISQSGTLRLWLPHESSNDMYHNTNKKIDTTSIYASNYFHELIFCEANEKRNVGACRLDTDIEYIIGGSTKVVPTMIHGAGEYLKRPTCVHVGIPDDAVITVLNDVRPIHDTTSSIKHIIQRLSGYGTGNVRSLNHIGLIVDIRPKKNVSREKGTCCVSHVVWEEKKLKIATSGLKQ